MMSIHKALVLLVAGLLVQGCGNLIKGDVDETPRLEQVDENVFLINFNAYDVGKALETLNGEAERVCEGRSHELAEYRTEPLGETRSWHVVKAAIVCAPRALDVVEPEAQPEPEPAPEPEPEVVWDEGDDPVTQGQKALAARGYDVGTPDGVQGEKTSSAIVQFQESAGLPQTGMLDALTSESLGTAPASNFQSVALIIAVQEGLEANGFDVGRIDGLMGKKTEDALLGYQAQNGLEETGQIDLATARSLGIIEE